VLDGTWFGGLELPVMVLVSKNQTKTMSEFWDKFYNQKSNFFLLNFLGRIGPRTRNNILGEKIWKKY